MAAVVARVGVDLPVGAMDLPVGVDSPVEVMVVIVVVGAMDSPVGAVVARVGVDSLVEVMVVIVVVVAMDLPVEVMVVIVVGGAMDSPAVGEKAAEVGMEMAEVVEAGEAGVEMEHPQPRQAHCHRRPPRCTRCSMMM